MTKLNEQHQFDLPYVAHDVFERNTYKYWLVRVDAGSRYMTTRLLRAKKTSDVAFLVEAIYKKGGVFKYPKIVNILLTLKKRFCFENVI